GSARSIPAFDLFNACMSIKDVFSQFGGHAQAAGMSLPLENISLLEEKLNAIIINELEPEDFTQVVDVNRSLALSDIDESLIKEIECLAPFGMDNPKPIFHLEEIPIEIRQIGSQKNHLKMEFKKDTYALSGIGFGMGHLFSRLSKNTPISVIGELGINEWNGNRKIQIVIQDIGVNVWQLFDYRGKKEKDLQTITSESTNDVLVLGTEDKGDSEQYMDLPYSTYDKGVDHLFPVSTLIVSEMPDSLDVLQKIIKKTNPVNIYACYSNDYGVYMQTFPSREDFIWFYGLVQKRKALDLKKELRQIIKQKKWTKDRIIFISQVFQELGFVTLDNGIVYAVHNPIKRDLQDSSIYQQRLNHAEIEKVLYYSTYDALKEWFGSCFQTNERLKEEVATYGL
ncbi:MAG TPA: single-stranded-DNA-specific exonuclease C-terminal domain-containing protein, partial [Bacillota bacterium]|nr:single-stranded-DNA-specific exonuclease C-terminal domain-containing protein [Bacillota bacterium]